MDKQPSWLSREQKLAVVLQGTYPDEEGNIPNPRRRFRAVPYVSGEGWVVIDTFTGCYVNDQQIADMNPAELFQEFGVA